MRAAIRSERGEAAALEMMLVIGFLLLPTLVGLAQIPLWIDARSTGELAAQEAARQVALATDFDAGVASADAIARQIVVNHGWGEDAYQGLSVTGSNTPGASVTASVTVEVPAIVVPMVGEVGGGFSRTWSHTEVVDAHREDP
ncbi:MAG: hypothetical protein ACR2JP_04800 [Acidimicrobiia bacterium]